MKWLDRVIRDWRISKALPHISKAKSVLDIGCGDGKLCQLLSKRGITGIGIDSRLSQAVAPDGFEFVFGLFPDALTHKKSFDAISVLAVLEHIPPDQKHAFIKACYERLSANGVVVLTVPSPKVDVILAVLRFFRLIDGIAVEEHHDFDPSGVRSLFESSGFSLLSHKKFQLGLNNLYVFNKRIVRFE